MERLTNEEKVSLVNTLCSGDNYCQEVGGLRGLYTVGEIEKWSEMDERE
jgi:hypothetical protein